MPFSKDEMQEELSRFLSLAGKQIAQMYGASESEWTGEESVKRSPIWVGVSEMYDYGVMGVPTGDLGPGGIVNGVHAHIDMFLRAMDTPCMRVYLEQCDNAPPRLAMLAVQSAVARMVLDGGDRFADFAAGEFGIGNGDVGYLTLSEVALLANMDERSVRNAANPKLPDPLKTEQVGKRSLVNPEEARRWLSGRKRFVPTSKHEGVVPERPQEFDMEVSEELVAIIKQKAKKAGVSFEAYFKKVLFKIFEDMEK